MAALGRCLRATLASPASKGLCALAARCPGPGCVGLALCQQRPKSDPLATGPRGQFSPTRSGPMHRPSRAGSPFRSKTVPRWPSCWTAAPAIRNAWLARIADEAQVARDAAEGPELLTRWESWCNTVRPIWRTLGQTSAKGLVKQPPLVLSLARCRQLHFINFLTAASRDRGRNQKTPVRRTDAVCDGAAMSGVLGPRSAVDPRRPGCVLRDKDLGRGFVRSAAQ